MIHILGPGKKLTDKSIPVINTTSHSDNWSRGLSPFFLGPVTLADGRIAQTVENAWQYSKVYLEHVDWDRNPTSKWFEWSSKGFQQKKADRYPMGKGAKPLYSYWDGQRLGYIDARKQIYVPLYAAAVLKSTAWQQLKETYEQHQDIALWDFDGYDHRQYNYNWRDVLDNPSKTMGHAFVLAMLLEGANPDHVFDTIFLD